VLSDDGRTLLVVIAMLGNVFSPSYLDARKRATLTGGAVNPLDYCTFNVALYTEHRNHWVLTESFAHAVERNPTELRIGSSWVRSTGSELIFELDEFESPFGQRLRGQIRVEMPSVFGARVALTASGQHTWQPVAPLARAQVVLREPNCQFDGDAYVDTNAGTEPLEAGFRSWSWSRALLASGASVISYAAVDHANTASHIHLVAKQGGGAFGPVAGLTEQPLGRSSFGLARYLHADPGARVHACKLLENSPFYARTRLRTQILGVPALVVHEQVSLTRFIAPWVQFLLPFRMRNARPWRRRRAAAQLARLSSKT
jgi:carotenoid 1,2-hydratase